MCRLYVLMHDSHASFFCLAVFRLRAKVCCSGTSDKFQNREGETNKQPLKQADSRVFFPRLQHSARPWISPDCKTTQIPARQMGLPCHEVPWQLLFDISPPRGSGPDLKTTLAGTGAFNRAFMSIWRLVCIVMPWQLTYLPEAVSTLRWFGDLLKKKKICRVTKSRSV